jgi:hypothetical protein
MGSNPHANGGELLQPLSMPHFHDYAVGVPDNPLSSAELRLIPVAQENFLTKHASLPPTEAVSAHHSPIQTFTALPLAGVWLRRPISMN